MFWVFIKKGCVFFNQVLKPLLIGLCFLIFLTLIVSFGVQAFWTLCSIVKYPELFLPNSDLNYVSYAFAWKFEFLSFLSFETFELIVIVLYLLLEFSPLVVVDLTLGNQPSNLTNWWMQLSWEFLASSPRREFSAICFWRRIS
jgi:hypothetical protein